MNTWKNLACLRYKRFRLKMDAPNAPNPANPNAQDPAVQNQDQVPVGPAPPQGPIQPIPPPVPIQLAPAGVMPIP